MSKNIDEIEKILLGDDIAALAEVAPKRSSKTSMSDFIMFYLFIEKIREKERNDIINALQQSLSEDREVKKMVAETIKSVASKIDKMMDLMLEAYIPFRFRVNQNPSQPSPNKVEVEIDV